MQAIETRYKGYRFRSRLEARWAVFFDALGIEWQYEPEGFILDDGTMYLPDFYLPLFDCYAEVKPRLFSENEYNKCNGLPKPCILLDASYPKSGRGYFVTKMFSDCCEYSSDTGAYGNILLDQSAQKDRLWFLLGESISDYWIDDAPEIAAKSARFEHGEKPDDRHYRDTITNKPR